MKLNEQLDRMQELGGYNKKKKKKKKSQHHNFSPPTARTTATDQESYNAHRKAVRDYVDWITPQVADWCMQADVEFIKFGVNHIRLKKDYDTWMENPNKTKGPAYVKKVAMLDIWPSSETWYNVNKRTSGKIPHGDFIPFIERFFGIYI